MSDETKPSDDRVPDRFSVDFTGVTLLATYRVEKLLAEGGMGSIYLARDTNLGQTVVVKVPHPRFLGEPGFRGRFAQEVTELVRLEHPHVARILAQGEHEDVPFFVLQFLGGGSLEDRQTAAPDGRLDPNDVVPWLTTIAETLDFVNARGIVHRDVKPANILFDEGGHIFLSDFGVAKTLEGEDSGLTATGAAIGSPKHMAPEQGTSDHVGPAADQYGLASSVYEVLTGQSPFGNTKVLQALILKTTEDPPDVRDRLPDLPQHAAAAIMRALSREPGDRFPSCAEFAAAFTDGLRAEAAAGPAAPPPAPPSAPPRRAGHLVALVLVLAALGVGAFFMLGSHGTEPPPPADPPPSPAVDDTRDSVILLDPGVKPRQVLRYRVAEGATERLLLTSESQIVLGPEPPPPDQSPSPPTQLGVNIHVDEVAEDGTIEFRWLVVSTDALEKEGVPSSKVDLFRNSIASMVGMTVWASADDRGRLADLRVGRTTEEATSQKDAPAGFAAGVEELCTPFPEEPVGVGARWEVTRSVSGMGIRLTHIVTFELVSLEGYRAEIRSASAIVAPAQDLEDVMPGGPDVKLDSLHGNTKGTSLLDLTQLVPVTSRQEAHMAFVGTRTEDGESKPVTIDVTSLSVIERR